MRTLIGVGVLPDRVEDRDGKGEYNDRANRERTFAGQLGPASLAEPPSTQDVDGRRGATGQQQAATVRDRGHQRAVDGQGQRASRGLRQRGAHQFGGHSERFGGHRSAAKGGFRSGSVVGLHT